jgi:hypothetical protein
MDKHYEKFEDFRREMKQDSEDNRRDMKQDLENMGGKLSKDLGKKLTRN